MTAQVSDKCFYREEKYSIVALSNVIPFDPKNFGLEPVECTTSCHRGYWCEYEINGKRLLLKNLYIYSLVYPSLNGKVVAPEEFVESMCYSPKTKEWTKGMTSAHSGHRVYYDVNLPIPYTGKIALGKNFLDKYYVHMGFQQAWAYETLLEMEFEEGLLTKSTDLSRHAKAKRNALEEKRKKEKEEPCDSNPQNSEKEEFYKEYKWIAESFSLDYGIKAWWEKKE